MGSVAGRSGASGQQWGDLEAGLGPGRPAQLALVVRAVSHIFQAVVRRESTQRVVRRVGSPGYSRLSRCLAAALHLYVCEMGLCKRVWFASVSAGRGGGGLHEACVQHVACVRASVVGEAGCVGDGVGTERAAGLGGCVEARAESDHKITMYLDLSLF